MGSVRCCLGRFGDNGNDVGDVFVSTRYRSELWKKWGGEKWEAAKCRRTVVWYGVCHLLFGAIGDK